jgi:site-specific DNA recombinase
VNKRCAIYTRKSTEEGLEQAFNSLDAQREACAAYIKSQVHEGWELTNERYEDGGWSGGNLSRPGLQQLLADVAAGKIDVIVVYKVDRLTRSLADFARIVDVLDKAGASFVSVTQAFNTTNSMGRLTLNVLLSFAQFEREVTSERIRDKVAASKRKGIWMGGPVPIGYRLGDRKLIIDDTEAATVRLIFERYLELRSVGRLAEELAEREIRTKVRTYSDGRVVGGGVFARGPLAQLLRNPVYIGKVAQGGELHDGEHEAILDCELWEAAQRTLELNRHERRTGSNVRNPSLLTGMIRDPEGRPMTPVFTTKGPRRHQYYVTRLQPGEKREESWRVPAGEIDAAVIRCVEEWLRRCAEQIVGTDDAAKVREVLDLNDELAAALSEMTIPEQRGFLLERSVGVQLGRDSLQVSFGEAVEQEVTLPARLARKGTELKLVVSNDAGQAPSKVDAVLLKLVALSQAAKDAALKGADDPLVSHYSKRHLWQLLRISWLAPDILTAIVDGGQPPTLTGRRLLRATDIPLDWSEQRTFFGFG